MYTQVQTSCPSDPIPFRKNNEHAHTEKTHTHKHKSRTQAPKNTTIRTNYYHFQPTRAHTHTHIFPPAALECSKKQPIISQPTRRRGLSVLLVLVSRNGVLVQEPGWLAWDKRDIFFYRAKQGANGVMYRGDVSENIGSFRK
jgi:hypothetical protein